MCGYRVCAILWIVIGIYVAIYTPFFFSFKNKLTMVRYIIKLGLYSKNNYSIDSYKETISQSLAFTEGSPTYKAWISPTHLTFKCYLFNVTNPDEIMQGSNPNLDEVGPFTYE